MINLKVSSNALCFTALTSWLANNEWEWPISGDHFWERNFGVTDNGAKPMFIPGNKPPIAAPLEYLHAEFELKDGRAFAKLLYRAPWRGQQWYTLQRAEGSDPIAVVEAITAEMRQYEGAMQLGWRLDEGKIAMLEGKSTG